MITKLDQIVRAVQGRGRKKLAVAYAQDSHTLEAVNAATDMGIVEAILIGDREQIVKVCMADGIDPEKFSIVDEKNDTVCVETAVRMIRDSMRSSRWPTAPGLPSRRTRSITFRSRGPSRRRGP